MKRSALLVLFVSVQLIAAAQPGPPGSQHLRSAARGQDSPTASESYDVPDADQNEIYNLEHDFGQALVRKDKNFLADHLADDLIEVGWNGLVFTKDKLLGLIGYVDVSQYDISNVKFRSLDRDAVLLTYDLNVNASAAGKSAPSHEYASSVWVKRDGKWVMELHQSTPANHH